MHRESLRLYREHVGPSEVQEGAGVQCCEWLFCSWDVHCSRPIVVWVHVFSTHTSCTASASPHISRTQDYVRGPRLSLHVLNLFDPKLESATCSGLFSVCFESKPAFSRHTKTKMVHQEIACLCSASGDKRVLFLLTWNQRVPGVNLSCTRL